jgi:ABC-2 type transport system permease protein
MSTTRYETSRARLAMGAFVATLHRDLVVTGREFIQFLVQALMQPIFFLFIFGKVLPSIGLAAQGFTALLLPGIVALSSMLASLQGVTLPLVLDLGFAREIDDRLLAPLPAWMVAMEKLLIASVRGTIAGLTIFPVGALILGQSFAVRTDRIGTLALMILLTAATGAAIGLLMGTVIKPEQISLMFTLIFTPLIFTGCTYYPWPALNHIRWFQAITMVNPLTYCSEGLRYAMVPAVGGRQIPTMEIGWVVVALIVGIGLCAFAGTRTFLKRVVN